MKLRIRKVCLIGLLFILPVVLGACKKEETGTAYKIYYVNQEETGILFKEYRTETTQTEALLEELLLQLETIPEKLEYKAPFTGNVKLIDYSLSEDQLILNFDFVFMRYLFLRLANPFGHIRPSMLPRVLTAS